MWDLRAIRFSSKTPTTSNRSVVLHQRTVRYANNAANCIDLFGPKILSDEFQIYEIGAGYGGECKIFNDYATTLYSRSLRNWTTFDLPSSYGLIRKFLSQFGYQMEAESLEAFVAPNRPSLVMSNAALSEMRGSLLETYMERVVRPASHGYFITNFDTHSKPYGGWSTEEFLRALHRMGKGDARELHTISYLSHFDKCVGSRLIVFGTNAPTKRNVYSWVDVAKIIAIQKAYSITRRLMVGA